jgi:regulator of sigma E protease
MPAPADYKTGGTVENAKITITSLAPHSPAEAAGIKTGDTILKLSAPDQTLTEFSIEDIQTFVGKHANQPINLEINRAGATQTVVLTPMIGQVADRATMGVTLDVLGIVKTGFFQSFWEGLKLTWMLAVETVTGLAKFFGQIFIGKAQLGDVAGPVGIAGLVGDAARLGFIYVVTFTALISINLAVINLIPFPALDGGRILFVLIEAIMRKPISPKVANILNTVGFALLILLMIVVTVHDISKLW